MTNSLKKYQGKRNFNKTKEPKGSVIKSSNKLRFCIQHHIARKDHYDFRLEWNGALKSWAIPKGPSYDYTTKRLAIMVEDHPLTYRHFEGTIPQGEYGAGTVMLWDEGYWIPTTKINNSFNMSNFKFILKGKRLKGLWTMIHLKNNNWLLIKEKDNVKGFKNIKRINKSIKTNRTMREITNEENFPILTNPQKKITNKYTKEEIFNYYKQVAFRMLPYIENRLISVIRAPSGIKGEIFFKKHLENKNPGIKKINLPSDKTLTDYYYITNIYGLLSEVQMNSFEFHPWGSKVNDLEQADILVFDLDPDKSLPITKLRQGVKDLKSILDSLNLKSYLKTSGGKGYHILVPLKVKMSWQQARNTAQNIALLMEEKWPQKYTSNIRKNKRHKKIFIDWIRNTKSSTSVAPYSIRLRKNLPVSMPIKWSELDKIKPNEITMEEAIKRLKRVDPWKDFFA